MHIWSTEKYTTAWGQSYKNLNLIFALFYSYLPLFTPIYLYLLLFLLLFTLYLPLFTLSFFYA